MAKSKAGGALGRLRNWFPEREFLVRSQGQVRFITITSRVQIAAASLALGAAVAWSGSMGVMGIEQLRASTERASLLEREMRVAQAEERFTAYRDEIAATTADLERRQDFIESMIELVPEDMQQATETERNTSTASGTLTSMIDQVFPETHRLARIEARQLAFAERLTRHADERAARAEEAMRTLGLDPNKVLDSQEVAVGGPFERLISEGDSALDPRFEQLAASLVRMSALERGLRGIPQVMPADIDSISSGFGYRRDPFSGAAAMHSGLDFRAPHGSPIHAAAAGMVTFAGSKSGYGRTVEITHGSGMITRYAHMSRWNASVGQKVKAGAVIGAIGSTGRSTGPHLHFEVRINNRAVNPRPFLETAPHVLEEARSEPKPASSASRG